MNHYACNLLQRVRPGGVPGLDHKPVAEQSVQDQSCRHAEGPYSRLCHDVQLDACMSALLAVLRNVPEKRAQDNCPVPPVEEGPEVDVRCALQLVHSEGDHSGKEANVRRPDNQEGGWEEEPAV